VGTSTVWEGVNWIHVAHCRDRDRLLWKKSQTLDFRKRQGTF